MKPCSIHFYGEVSKIIHEGLLFDTGGDADEANFKTIHGTDYTNK